jgi:hypothetical protein
LLLQTMNLKLRHVEPRGMVGMRSTAGTVYWDDIKLIAAGSGGGSGTTCALCAYGSPHRLKRRNGCIRKPCGNTGLLSVWCDEG